MNGNQPRLRACFADTVEYRLRAGSASGHDMGDLLQSKIPAQLADRNDEIFSGHHHDLLNPRTGLQGLQSTDEHRIISQSEQYLILSLHAGRGSGCGHYCSTEGHIRPSPARRRSKIGAIAATPFAKKEPLGSF